MDAAKARKTETCAYIVILKEWRLSELVLSFLRVDAPVYSSHYKEKSEHPESKQADRKERNVGKHILKLRDNEHE